MKYFIKVILPPLFAFWAFALFIKFTPVFHHVNAAENMGEDSVYGLISYYKIFAPAQIIIALLTQFLIVMPLWRKIIAKPKSAILIFITLILICAIFAFGLAYAIWDPETKKSRFIDIGWFMTGVQLFYWVINFLLLYLLDWKAFRKTQPVAETDNES
ncbi:hypothetical protein FO440_17640 [Mucilaginibacter corticis]|uniref:Uncharacterized protein n=1 Tax=Mucilaginibacter corticis TaxID=2597670 RepID=A0A556MIB3_9SPHI|nr:hypothetical protein [Mucilaginibacter corticis]TSJ39565.1 hypothetical protein FO440_17640 [Mucilaginibacter corticis]